MENQPTFLIGCDPEFFLTDAASKFISSIGLVGGSKHEPLPIGNGCAVQEDNVAVEFCIPPAESVDAFINSINYTLAELAERVGKYELKFSPVASAVFDEDQLQHPAALEFGCEPDYNAWTRKMNPRPRADNMQLRSAGGHVHVGYKTKDKHQLIRAMDLFLGVPSIKLDKDTERRKLYGKAGAFRPKPYGAEYRTLSNFWIWDKKLIDWVYHQTAKAISFVEQGNTLDDEVGEIIQDCINNNNESAYQKLISTYQGV